MKTDTDVVVAPSILSADFGRLAEQLAEAEAAGADWIHIDVMDGHFVPNLTMGPVVVEACRRASSLPLDVHLMIEKPERLIDRFAAAGASSITVHYETCPHLHRTIEQIHAAGCKAGVAVNPGTPVELLEPVVDIVELVLVMSVNPGFSGQAFIPGVLKKVEDLSAWMAGGRGPQIVQMDGGISASTAAACYRAGCRAFVAGSAVFEHPGGIGDGIRAIREALQV